ncbi:MAG: SpoIIE family protein phosphatase [Ruminococcus sp.]|nr:SpoIIE family protein phosphatase [Candidatus Apopatosoma intestinale]
METYLLLFLVSLCPVVLSALIYLAERTNAARKIPYIARQVLIGIMFGALAIMGTEFGVKIDGAVINARDASPICAGLLFGAPAGIIAGVIGGVERWLAVFWGAGEYTRLACSISTILAGVFAAVLRKYMFDNKKPKWNYCLATAIITEVVHMLMIFLTNMSDVHTAFSFVRACSLPMVAINGLSVMLAGALLSLLSEKERKSSRHNLKNISQSFQRWLLMCVTAGFLMTTVFTWALQTELAKNDANELIRLNIEDVREDILEASNKNLLELTREIASRIDFTDRTNAKLLKTLKKEFDVAEINIINQNGIITVSTHNDFLNYDMRGGKQSAEFLVLLDGVTKEYVQSYQPTSSDPTISRKYAGVVLSGGGFVQVAYDAERFQKDIDDVVIGVTRNRHIGESGALIIVGEDWNIVSDRHGNEGRNLNVTGIYIDRSTMPENKTFEAVVYGKQAFCSYIFSEGYYIVAVMPLEEAMFSRDISVYITVFMEFVVFGMLFIVVYFLIKKLVVDNMVKINKSLAMITGGNLDTVVNVRTNEEFASLSDDINSTVVTLKHYIAEAAARIDRELEFAKSIQHSAIPTVFPPYPGHSEFDIYATMDTAKEVGGDFYDFYFVGENRLGFLIADVSGKGIPAAMFMMTAKTIIKGYAESGKPVDEVFTTANEKLCESNDAGMFVTAWMGVLDTVTGKVEFANAGHNPPLVRHAGGGFEYLRSKPCFILAGMDGIKYRKNEFTLAPGDEIYLYTDGVTEATDSENNLYGEERLLALLNSMGDLSGEEICRAVKADIDAFVGDAPQFDDITMLYLKYNGGDAK